MNPTVLFFFPHNPYPPKTGAHKRCFELLSGFRELGCEVILLSSTISSENKWLDSSVERLEAEWVRAVRIYEAGSFDYRFRANLQRYYRLIKRSPPVNSALYTPPGMRWWFRQILREYSPQIIVINYAYWDGLLNHRRLNSVLRVIETHDLVTLNQKMQTLLSSYLQGSRINPAQIDEQVLQEDFYNKCHLTAHPEEFRIYNKYNFTIAISSPEAEIIKHSAPQTKVILLRMTQEPKYIENRYTGSALFPMGPNPFNIQGYIYFVRKVLPKVLERAPSFTLDVTGSFYNGLTLEPTDRVCIKGFVPDLVPVYEESRFVVCPVMGGTGQQVKIVEAMAYGLPVIAIRSAADRSPIKHGINGLVANDAQEFANHVIQLWQDQQLCRKLGQAARETIEKEFSQDQLVAGISSIINEALIQR